MIQLKSWKEIGLFFSSLVICQAPGLFGAYYTSQSIPTWYAGLVKPSFAPPNEIYAPVWITLYLLMGFSLYIVWRRPANLERDRALGFFFFQLALNALWPLLFFGLHFMWISFGAILLLWTAILFACILFYPLARLATWLLLPYLAWVTFAVFLNYRIVRLNGL